MDPFFAGPRSRVFSAGPPLEIARSDRDREVPSSGPPEQSARSKKKGVPSL